MMFTQFKDETHFKTELKERLYYKKKLYEIFPESTKLRDLLENMLVFDPKNRFDAKKCLRHNYFSRKRKRIYDYDENNKRIKNN